jgi:hypothetical protein
MTNLALTIACATNVGRLITLAAIPRAKLVPLMFGREPLPRGKPVLKVTRDKELRNQRVKVCKTI